MTFPDLLLRMCKIRLTFLEHCPLIQKHENHRFELGIRRWCHRSAGREAAAEGAEVDRRLAGGHRDRLHEGVRVRLRENDVHAPPCVDPPPQ